MKTERSASKIIRTEDLAKALNLNKLTGEDNNIITGVYIGDMLSVVMSDCQAGDAWITSQTHPNITNVASINEVACVIIAGDANVDQSLIDKAEEAEIILFSCEKKAYELAWRIHEVLG